MIIRCGIGTTIERYIGPYECNRRAKRFCVDREHDKTTSRDNASVGIAKQSQWCEEDEVKASDQLL